jgi:iron complex transport system substrate-binding protein
VYSIIIGYFFKKTIEKVIKSAKTVQKNQIVDFDNDYHLYLASRTDNKSFGEVIMKFKIVPVFLLILIVFAVLATGCTNSKETPVAVEPIEEVEEVAVESEYPLVIKHAFGETIIESKPERIATISWGNHDVPLALGIEPVGVSMANYGVLDESGLLPWTKAAFEKMGVTAPVIFNDMTGLDYEAINDAEPDVILAAYSGITQEEYNLLSEIAPVIAYPENAWQTYWRDQILLNSKGMGMQKEGQTLVAELENLISDKIAGYPVLEGKTAAFFWFNPTDMGKFYVYLPADPRAAYLTDLGMVFPQSVLDIAKGSESFAIELSAENADLLNDIDVIVTYGNEELLEIMKSDALIGMIPAVKRGSVAVIEDGTPLAASGTPSALSIGATIDEYLEILAAAAGLVE